jgi:hypothetical protein
MTEVKGQESEEKSEQEGAKLAFIANLLSPLLTDSTVTTLT